jgi:hypothetical protein
VNATPSDGDGYTRGPGAGVTWTGGIAWEVQVPLLTRDGIQDMTAGMDQDGEPVRLHLFIDEAMLLLRASRSSRMALHPDPWHAEFAHPGKTIAPEDDDRREEVPSQEPEVPSFNIGDQVVFRDSDPGTRREWTVAEFDTLPGMYTIPGTPLETCTVRRGSTVKRGVSFSRLELAISPAE